MRPRPSYNGTCASDSRGVRARNGRKGDHGENEVRCGRRADRNYICDISTRSPRAESSSERTGVLLVWLLPIAFGLHVTEEFLFPGGFVAWDRVYRPKYGDTPASYFVKVNAVPGVASVLVSLGAFDYAGNYSFFGIRGWLAFLTFMAFNSWFHLRGAIQTRRYSPGMVTGMGLFVPLAVIGYVHFANAGVVDIPSMIVCIAFALMIQPVLDFIKRRPLH